MSEFLTDEEIKREVRRRIRGKHARVTNNPHTWPACDRPLTPAELTFAKLQRQEHERTGEAAPTL